MISPETLLRTIQALPAERIAEIADFVDFIAAREHAASAIRESRTMSAPSFAAIWNNAEDSAYDAL